MSIPFVLGVMAASKALTGGKAKPFSIFASTGTTFTPLAVAKPLIAQSVYYSWSKAFMDAGKARLNGDTKREADSGEVAEMRKQNGELKEALAEEILRNRFLKKLSKGME